MSQMLNWDITLRHRRTPLGEKYLFLKVQVFAVNLVTALSETTARLEELSLNPLDWEFAESQILLTPSDLENGKVKALKL